ncbi:MAG: hypothetical protein WCA56_05800 [Xanthobacteraceae bacterium]
MFADVYEGEAGFFLALVGHFGKQRRFLCAANGQRRARSYGRAKSLKLGAAQLAGSFDLRATAAASHRTSIERHRVLTRTKNNGLPEVDHLFHGVAPSSGIG